MIKKFGIFILSFSLSCLAAEVFLRVFLPQQLIRVYEGIWEPNAETAWHHQKNADVYVNTGERRIRFATDSFGYRIDPERKIDRREQKKVVLIGDSFVEAVQVHYQDTLAARIDRRINNDLGQSFEVVNNGVSGWSPAHYLAASRKMLSDPNFKAELAVVFLFVGNDLKDSIEEVVLTPSHPHPDVRISKPGSLRYEALVMAFLYPFDRYMESIFHFYVFLKNRSEVLRARLGLTRHALPGIFFEREAHSEAWVGTAEACKQIEWVWKARDIPVIFVLLPAVYQVDEKSFEHYAKMFKLIRHEIDLTQPNKMLAQTFAHEGLILIDPLETMRTAQRNGKRLYGKIDRHLSAAGHQVVSDFIYPEILSRMNERALS